MMFTQLDNIGNNYYLKVAPITSTKVSIDSTYSAIFCYLC
jgi:hypothetical protein